MPLSKHYGGAGEKVMKSMRKTYHDPEKAKEVFYATENARKKNAKGKENPYRALRPK